MVSFKAMVDILKKVNILKTYKFYILNNAFSIRDKVEKVKEFISKKMIFLKRLKIKSIGKQYKCNVIYYV